MVTKEKKAIWTKKYRDSLRESVFNILGHKCVRCGFTDKRALQFDHKNGLGNQDIRKHGGSLTMYSYYKYNPQEAKKELQVLCANCNWIKRHENKENRT